MSGIVFVKTAILEEIEDFYTTKVGMKLWLTQKDIRILKHGNMLIGFHQQSQPDTAGLLTFFYPTKSKVDEMYKIHKESATIEVKENPTYKIYHFFAKDPEGRNIEFQHFLEPVSPYLDSEEMLVTRRSIRKYSDREISCETLWSTFDSCRFAPTARNTQAFYYILIKNKEKIDKLANIRPGSSKPIGEAPVAVAVCVDKEKTGRPSEDGHIAAYHLLLSAHNNGLGTCWIGGMDRDDVRVILDIPDNHYIAAITPLGYPAEEKAIPERRPMQEIMKFIE